MSWKVLISSSHMQSRLERYRDLLDKNNIETDTISRPQFVPEADLLEIVAPYHAIVCSDDEITDRVLDRAKNLRLISKWGVGINSIDLESAKKRGISVYNSPGAFSESCALMVFSYILHFSRGVVEQDRLVRSGEWKHLVGTSLSDKTIGVVGVGGVGKAVIKRARAFDMGILGNDIKEIDQEFIANCQVNLVNKEDLFRRSDFIILATDLNPSSVKLAGEPQFNAMKPSAFVINISRGPVVDEKALINALENKKIAGAGLDVFETEPLPQNSPLLKFNNVLLTPHNAYNTLEVENYVHENTIKNLIDGLNKLTG